MAPSKTREFDEAVLQKMAEPITVYVSRIVSGKKTPVPLPVKEGYQTSGQGYTQMDVREIAVQLQQMWTEGTLRDGVYEVSATDSQQLTMEWQMMFAEQSAPMPQQVAAARAATHAQAQQLAATPANNFGPPVYPGMPSAPVYPAPLQWGSVRPPVPQYPQPQQQASMQMPQQWTPPPTVVTAPADKAAEERARQAELREIETRNQAERQRLQFEHQQALAASQAQAAAQIAELKALVQQAQARPPEPSAELQVLKDQLAEQKRQSEMTTMMSGFKEMIAAVNQSTQAQIQSLTQLVTMKPAVDPMVQMIMESNKNQMEALKETTRVTLEAMKDQQRNQTSARDMLDIADRMRQSSGIDQLLPKMVETYSGAWSMMRQGMEMVQSMTQGPAGNPLLEGAAKVISELPSIAEKYMKMMRDTSVGEANWKTAQAEAERERARVERDVIRAQTGQPIEPQVAEAVAQAGGLSGAPPSVDVVEAAKATTGATPINVESAEMQLFGPALEHVKQLRAAVVAGIAGDPKALDTPEKAFAAVAQALDAVQSQNLGDQVKAVQFFANGMVSQFVEVLLPPTLQIPGPYMNELVSRLQALYAGLVSDDEDNGDEEEEKETSNG